MIPTIGRIVHYTLNDADAEAINRRRDDFKGWPPAHSGYVAHVGNIVEAGQIYPAVIVRVWTAAEGAAVNLQVLLDGTDTYWATSRSEGEGQGRWQVPPYQPVTAEAIRAVVTNAPGEL